MSKPLDHIHTAQASLAAAAGRRRVSKANAFPSYSTAELRRDLESPTLDAGTRAKIEAEILRRGR